jgi:hypothetical protein
MWETLIKSLGLDPKKIGTQLDQFQAGTIEALETMRRIETKLDELLGAKTQAITQEKNDDLHA